MRNGWRLSILSALALAGCNHSSNDGRGDAGQSGTGIATITGGSAEGGSDSGGTGDGTGASADGSQSGGSQSSAADSAADSDGLKFDLDEQPDVNLACGEGGGGGGGGADFSYIWIANSNESTVSKINTESMIEEGRYITRPDSNGNPSRTSVNLNGDMAIGNRNGGLTMIFARLDDCPNPANTSTGPADVKAWQDGCVGWHTPMAYISQRPVAWTAGTFNNSTCRYDDVKVWTSGANDPAIDVLLVDGATGVIDQTVPLPGEVVASYYGIYGGAVDSADNFWGSQLGVGHVVRVDREAFTVQTFPMPVSGYGMAVDRHDKVWTCSSQVGRFDYGSQTWQTNTVGGSGGCMPDGADLIWLANDPMVGVDIDTLAVVQTLDVPNYVHGVSIDFNGYVWGPAIYNNEAYRVDPQTGQVDIVTGFNLPYTYSDMTGFGLHQVGAPSG